MRIPLQSPARTLGAVLVAALALPIAGCARNQTRADLPYVARDVGTRWPALKRHRELDAG